MISALRQRAAVLRRALFPSSWGQISFAQEGEDILLGEIFADRPTGVYVEVGSHHPYRFSNTMRLYQRGWSGLCIDPLPAAAGLFRRIRPRDKFVAAGISRTRSTMSYFMFNEPALNTFDAGVADEWVRAGKYIVRRVVDVQTFPLRDVLAAHEVTHIDLLSVDVEGMDLEVLESNDWARWRPRWIVAECNCGPLAGIANNSLVRFLSEREYIAEYRVGRNLFFRSAEASREGHVEASDE